MGIFISVTKANCIKEKFLACGHMVGFDSPSLVLKSKVFTSDQKKGDSLTQLSVVLCVTAGGVCAVTLDNMCLFIAFKSY